MSNELSKLFNQVLLRTEEEKLVILTKLANQAQNYFVSSWRTQSFDGKAWENVKRRDSNENLYKYPKNRGLARQTNPILIGGGYYKTKKTTTKGGTLRRAVSNMMSTANYSQTGVKMSVNLPYARIHNEGLEGKAFGKYAFKMKKRQFIGETAELRRKQEKLISTEILKLFKK